MKKVLLPLLSLLLITSMLMGCAPAAEEPEAVEPEAPAAEEEEPAVEEAEEPKPTSVIVAITFPPGSFDPIGAGSFTAIPFLSFNMFTALYGRDATNAIVPKLALSEEKSEDGMSVTFKVRTDTTFHNGDPVTVDDIVYSYNTYMANPSGQIMLNYVGPVMTKIDDETVSITLTYPNVDYKGIMQFIYIVPKALHENDPEGFSAKPIGSGAYQFVSYTNNELVEMKAFEDYFEGVAPIETLFAKVISDSSTAAIALESGEIDVLFNVYPFDLERLSTDENLVVYKTLADSTMGFSFHNGEEIDNIKLRQAIFHAINPEDALIAARNGEGELPTNLTPARNIGSLAGVVDYSDAYNPELAKQLLEESGYDPATVLTLSLAPAYFGPDAASAGVSIANNLREIGINIETETLDANVYSERWFAGDLQMGIESFGFAPMNITDNINWFTLSGDITTVMYLASIKTPELDEATQAARFALTEEEYQEAGEKMVKLFYETYMVVPLYTAYVNVVHNAQLKNVICDPAAYGYVEVFYWTY